MKNFNWTSLDEKWFSDKLNNLLTSRGAGHKFRTRFCKTVFKMSISCF